ncbi:hypothetical protein JCM33374_g4759 [Metschnikowia sp. JCM 33374]|nr:hypothetical protein JCM33374_g4759 [Metschnikowia sp. JCM 33374]
MLSENTVVVGGVQGPQTTQLINAFLRTLSINWASETCLVVVPTKAAADLLDIQGTLLPLSFKCDSNGLHLFQKIASVIDGLEKVSQISGNLGLHGYDFESSIRTALMFYHAHVEPTWAKFLKSANEKNLHAYPFAYIERETFDDNLKAIADHFSGIRAMFAQLEGQLALDKFQLRELSQNDVEQIGDYFLKTSQYVIVPESDLGKIDRVFDNVIIHDVSSLPYIRGGFKRIAAFGDFPGDWAPRANVSVPQNRSELALLIGGGAWMHIRLSTQVYATAFNTSRSSIPRMA